MKAFLASFGRRGGAIVIVSLVLLTAGWGVTFERVVHERREAEAGAFREVRNLVLAFEQDVIRTLQNIEKAIRYAEYEFGSRGADVDLRGWFGDLALAGSPYTSVLIADERGMVIASTGLSGVDVSDRAWFRFHAADPSSQLRIGVPVEGRISGRPTITVSRRIDHLEGTLAGAVVVGITPSYFTSFFERIDIGARGSIQLVGLDGIVRARRMGDRLQWGGDLSESNLLRLAKTSEAGNFVSDGRLDGYQRFTSFRKVSGYPLLASVGVSVEEAMAPFRARRNNYYLAAAAGTLLVLVLSCTLLAGLARDARRLARARVQLVELEEVALAPELVAGDLDRLAARMTEAACRVTGAARANLWLFNEAETELRCIDLYEAPARRHSEGMVLKESQFKNEFDALKRAPYVDANEPLSDPRTAGYVDAYLKPLGITSMLDVVIAVSGRHLGLLCIEHVGRAHRWQNDEIDFGCRLADKFAAAIAHRDARAQMLRDAHFDRLTGLRNRALCFDRLQQGAAHAKRHRALRGLLLLDLDRFKNVNDSLGHDMGDAVLRAAAERLSGCVRAGDTVARVGGDEFALILQDLQDPQDAALVAKKVLQALSAPIGAGGQEVVVTASLGIAICPPDGEGAQTLMRNADAALQLAKRAGRNLFQFYTAEMNARVSEKLALERDLRRAMERGEFTLHYQPKAQIAGGRVTGFEALLRWNHNGAGLVSPAEFVPILEESGLIREVGSWVMREACRQLRAWQDAGLRVLPIAVNISAKQFHADLPASVQRALAEFGVAPDLLRVEITESEVMVDPERAEEELDRLKALGIRCAVDDFGTGYSSLSYLKRFQPDELKLDRSFVAGVPGNPNDVSITRAVISMAHSLGMYVVAEGVEKEEQRAFLQSHGCDQMQGYLLSRPLPAHDCARFLPPLPCALEAG